MSPHSENVLNQLHDQYLKGRDCDVILRAADHNGEASAKRELIWTNLHCHKIVLRAVSLFFDRIFSRALTSESLEDGVKAAVLKDESDERATLQITFSEISSSSLQTFLNFAYTGFVQIDSSMMKKTIHDLKILNALPMIDILEKRLQDEISFTNCIPNLILSSCLGHDESYKKILFFILEEFFRGLEGNIEKVEQFRCDLELTKLQMVASIVKNLEEVQALSLGEEKVLVNILVKLLKFEWLSEDEETRLVTFLASKKKEKCRVHLEAIVMYCYSDDEEICLKCLINGHEKHHIEPLGTAKHNRLMPVWKRVDLELEELKYYTKIRISELDELSKVISKEQSRDFEILNSCAEIKPKMDSLSLLFASGELDAANNDVLAFERFVDGLEKERKRTKSEYEKAKRISEQMLRIMEKRCASCSSIVDATYEIQTYEDLEDMDVSQPLDTKNCISILKQSKVLEDQDLYRTAFNYILSNFMDVVNDCGESFYRRISHSVLECFLKSDKLNVASEDQVLLVVEKWIEFNYGLRKKFTTELLSQVRFGNISNEVLQKIKNNQHHIVMRNEESKKLLDNAIDGAVQINPRESFPKTLFVLGDYGQNLILNAVNGTWEEWQGQDTGGLYGVVKVMNNIYFIGGENDADENLNKVSIYNLKTKVWKNGPSLLEPRCAFGTCVNSRNVIYVAGGYSQLKSVEMLQCDQKGEPIGEWQLLPPMNAARDHFEAACVDDKIYAIGGRNNTAASATVEVFDPKLKSWRNCKSMTQEKQYHSVSTYNGEIYVFGSEGHCEKYTPATDTWTTIATLNDANGYLRGSAVLNSKIYVIGGDCTEVDIYDIKSNSWYKGPQMPEYVGYTKCLKI